MEKDNKKPTLDERIKNLKQQIIGNGKDARHTRNLLNELLALHKQSLHEPVEIEVPVREVKETIDFGACKISRTIRGYLFEAKGGMHTFVSLRMTAVCTMLDTLFQLHNKEDKTDDEVNLYEVFKDAVLYCFQAPIFGSINEKCLFDISTDILRTFSEYCSEEYDLDEDVPETEEDIRENIEAEKMAEALEILAESPMPPEV